MRRLVPFLTAAVLLCASASGLPQARPEKPPQRIVLAPRFVPGSKLRYQIEIRANTEARQSGLVEDPQAPSQIELNWSAIVRVEVLSAALLETPPATRLRATYEKSQATTRSDTFDPEADTIERELGKLKGRSIEYSLDAEGNVLDVQGLQEILADDRAASAARDWLGRLAIGASLPREGIAPGQKWSAEQPAVGTPIAGTVWRSEATYLRNEPCQATAAGGTVAPNDLLPYETCAVILARYEMLQPRAPRDPTPEEYRKQGLRTAGKWSGTGESLTYVALRTSWVVSVTQSSTEEMDITVSTAEGDSRVRYTGRVRSQSQISLLPEAPVVPH